MKANLFSTLLRETSGPVAILGAGVSGCAAQKLLVSMGKSWELFDQKNRQFTETDAKRTSLVIQSPGFRPDHEWIKRAHAHGKKVFSEVDLGLSASDHLEFVAITGTNGKTSLTSILGHVCKELNIPSIELGNIGMPLSDAVVRGCVRNKIIFHETSSFQSTSSRCLHPDWVLWTNFAPDHLDYHGSEKEYFLSKLELANRCIFAKQVFLGSSVFEYGQKYGVEINPEFTEVEALSCSDLPDDIDIFHQNVPQLENLAFAMKWIEHRGIKNDLFLQALKQYSPHPYRLQKVAVLKDVCFWNDAKSTNLSSTLAACKSFTNKITWIGGGKSKGDLLQKFSESLYPYLDKAFLIGETARELAKNLKLKGIQSEVCESLKIAISKAFESAKRYTNIVFSPGFASFDMFSNYNERGNSFDSLVFDLKSVLQITTKKPINNL